MNTFRKRIRAEHSMLGTGLLLLFPGLVQAESLLSISTKDTEIHSEQPGTAAVTSEHDGRAANSESGGTRESLIPSLSRCGKNISLNPVKRLECDISRVKGDLWFGDDLVDPDPPVRGRNPGICTVATAESDGTPASFDCTCETLDSWKCYTEDDNGYDRYREACAAANPPLTGLDFLPPVRMDDSEVLGGASGQGICSYHLHVPPQDLTNPLLLFVRISSPAALAYLQKKSKELYGSEIRRGAMPGGCGAMNLDRDAVRQYITKTYCSHLDPGSLMASSRAVMTDLACCSREPTTPRIGDLSSGILLDSGSGILLDALEIPR